MDFLATDDTGASASHPEGFRQGAEHFLVGDLVFSLAGPGDWSRWDRASGAFVTTSLDWDASTPGLVPVTEEEALARLAEELGAD